MRNWEIRSTSKKKVTIVDGILPILFGVDKELAEHIIIEHNAHDELVKALEAFVKNEGYDRKDIREILVRNAEAALQKAKGKE